MIKQSELEQAYRIGVSRALQEAGLTKTAGPFGELLANPMVARALIGAGIGGVGGGVTDIGAGRGAMAGAAAGALSGPGQALGKRLLGKALASETRPVMKDLVKNVRARVPFGFAPDQALVDKLNNIYTRYGVGTPGWKENLGLASLAGGVGAGALGAGGVLALTNPPEKPWYQRMF